MTAAMPMRATQDQTDLPTLVRGGVTLGLIQSALVAAFAVLEVKLEGVMELVVCGPILLAGTHPPSTCSRSRSNSTGSNTVSHSRLSSAKYTGANAAWVMNRRSAVTFGAFTPTFGGLSIIQIDV